MKYVIIEALGRYSDGSCINEIEIYDSGSKQKLAYTPIKAYDTATGGDPAYWNRGNTWGPINLYNGDTTFGDSSSMIICWTGGAPDTSENTWCRIVLELKEEVNAITSKIYVGSDTKRIPVKINVYSCDSYNDNNYRTKNNDGLDLLKTLTFTGNETTSTAFEVVSDVYYYLLSDDEGIKTVDENGDVVLLEESLTEDLFVEHGIKTLSIVPDSYVTGSHTNKKVLMISRVGSGQKIKIKKSASMYNATTKRYEGTGAIYIPLKDLPENAKKCRIHLKGYNYFCKTALSKTPGQSSTLFTSDNPQYGGGILEIDMKAPPMTTTHKHTKDNPFMLCVSTGGDNGYLEAVSYSWL